MGTGDFVDVTGELMDFKDSSAFPGHCKHMNGLDETESLQQHLENINFNDVPRRIAFLAPDSNKGYATSIAESVNRLWLIGEPEAQASQQSCKKWLENVHVLTRSEFF